MESDARRVKVYTRLNCLFCHQVLDLLAQANIAVDTVEILDRVQQNELIARHQAVAFPIVVVDGHYVGGYAHILHLHSQGRLSRIASANDRPADPQEASVPSPSAVSTPASTRPSQRSMTSLVPAMSQLHQSLKENAPKKP